MYLVGSSEPLFLKKQNKKQNKKKQQKKAGKTREMHGNKKDVKGVQRFGFCYLNMQILWRRYLELPIVFE